VPGHVDFAEAAFLSDTIVIGLAASEPRIVPTVMHAGSVLHACYRAATLLSEALATEPHLAYRGCVTFGRFDIAGTFLLGPAIDEAASYYEQAEGAFVWLAPSAREVFEVVHRGRPALSPLVRYAVPLRQGASYETWVVSPFASVDTKGQRMERTGRLLGTFDKTSRLEVQVKRQHTERFLGHLQHRLDEAQASGCS
jgi:hypothetical protein